MSQLLPHLKSELDGAYGVTVLFPRVLEDGATKLLVRDSKRRPAYVVLVSSAITPMAVSKAMDAARAAHEAVGDELGEAILLPEYESTVDGRTYAALPYHKPLVDSRFYRWRYRRKLLPKVSDWLGRAVKATAVPVATNHREAAFGVPLEYLIESDATPPVVRDAAKEARARLGREWSPKWSLMHGDLWLSNILHAPAEGRLPFRLIDWPDCRVRGYAFYDLVRLFESFGGSRELMAQAVNQQVKSLDCERQDARSYLAAALGLLGLHRGHFPLEAYVAMAEKAVRRLDSVLELE